MGLARMERAKPIVVQAFGVVVTADELLLGHTRRSSHAQSAASTSTSPNLGGPKVLSLKYCVKFLDPLRGRFGNFADTTDHADVTDYQCSGSRIGCFVIDAGGMPATTELLRRERGDDFFEARLAA
jgi:hypothetical protein